MLYYTVKTLELACELSEYSVVVPGTWAHCVILVSWAPTTSLYSPSRPMRGNQAVLPTPQVRRYYTWAHCVILESWARYVILVSWARSITRGPTVLSWYLRPTMLHYLRPTMFHYLWPTMLYYLGPTILHYQQQPGTGSRREQVSWGHYITLSITVGLAVSCLNAHLCRAY
jgi:hypothetical protein